MIDSQQTLLPWLVRIGECSVLGLDTEADSLYCYPARLCLVQLALPRDSILIDPLAPLELDSLWRRLAGPELIIHGADYDLRLLAGLYGVKLPRVFDTMWASRFLGFRQFGLLDLVHHYFGIRLEKGSQKADWGRRPLTPKMSEYALNDVRYLLPLYERLKARLQAVGRLDWVREVGERLAEEAATVNPNVNGEPWRIKGSKKMTRRHLAFLKALWHWREGEAKKRSLPPFRILQPRLLLQIVNLAGEDKKWEGSLPVYWNRRYRREIRSCIARVRELTEGEWPEILQPVRRVPMTSSEKERVDRMRVLRDERAEQLGLDPTLIASKATLSGLARDPDVHIARLMNWQQELLGFR